jgi:hypothetical protein
MNFSKGFLFIFSLATLISTLLIIKDIPGLNKMYFYILVSSSVLTYIFNMYATYHIMFKDDVNSHLKDKNSKKNTDEESE